MYGKFALTNDQLFTAELFFVVGYALGGFTAALPSGVDMGVGLRMFLGQYFSVRLDIRDYLFIPDFENVENNIYISLGLSLTFGFGDEKAGGGLMRMAKHPSPEGPVHRHAGRADRSRPTRPSADDKQGRRLFIAGQGGLRPRQVR